MWRPILFVLSLTLSTLAIKVPVDGKDGNVTEIAKPSEAPVADNKEDAFYIPQPTDLDSYLIPPDPHRPQEVILSDLIVTPATYLLPPSPEKQFDYYVPTEAGEQTDWYPIAPQQGPLQSTPANFLPQRPPDVIPILIATNQTYELPHNTRDGKAYEGSHFAPPEPSRELQPPLVDAPNDYIVGAPSKELEVPSAEIDEAYYIPSPPEYQVPIQQPIPKKPKKVSNRIKLNEAALPLELLPPRLIQQKYRKGNKLYPKKVAKGFRPIPIPISQFTEQSTPDIPRAKPAKPFAPISSDESEYFTPPDEKQLYLYEQAEQKRKLREEIEAQQQQPAIAIAAEDTRGANIPDEQEASETNYRHPGPNAIPLPIHRRPHNLIHGPRPHRLRLVKPRPSPTPQQQEPSEQNDVPAPPPPGERTEFRMHGMNGPHSYQFGFDTGKGKNRQFRYEERDNDGRVRGHYGYMDKHGKLRVVNYDADPKTGFHAEAPVEKA